MFSVFWTFASFRASPGISPVRTGDIPGEARKDAKVQKTENIVVTELENRVLEIDEVPMDEEEEGWNLAEAA